MGLSERVFPPAVQTIAQIHFVARVVLSFMNPISHLLQLLSFFKFSLLLSLRQMVLVVRRVIRLLHSFLLVLVAVALVLVAGLFRSSC